MGLRPLLSLLSQRWRGRLVTVVCNQTGDKLSTSVDSLSKENGSLEEHDLAVGSQLLYEKSGKTYPVTLIEQPKSNGTTKRNGTKKVVAPGHKRTAKKSKADNPVPCEKSAKKRALTKAMEEFTESDSSHSTTNPEASSEAGSFSQAGGLSQSEKDLLIKMDRKIDRLENLILALLKAKPVKEEGVASTITSPELMVNGVNLLNIPFKDANAYGRNLLDILFTKEEQKHSVVLATKKSPKPPLDRERVERLFDCVRRRHGESGFDFKTLLASLNQKCRDAKVDVVIQ